jgi:hypothetical protein
MPVHDWTRVTAGTFHAFHNAWITHLQEALNGRVLPNGYYALGAQRSGDIGPEILTLHADTNGNDASDYASPSQPDGDGMLAVIEYPPNVSLALEASRDAAFYIAKRRTLVIYHSTGDRIVALIDIVSPGNKHSQRTIETFLDKSMAALNEGYHLLGIDLFPPARYDPNGLNGLIREYLNAERWKAPAECQLSFASYCAKSPVAVYVEPIAVGMQLTDMPLFLTSEHYVNRRRAAGVARQKWRLKFLSFLLDLHASALYNTHHSKAGSYPFTEFSAQQWSHGIKGVASHARSLLGNPWVHPKAWADDTAIRR